MCSKPYNSHSHETRITPTSNTLIDHIITDCHIRCNQDFTLLDVPGLDHKAILYKKTASHKNSSKVTKTFIKIDEELYVKSVEHKLQNIQVKSFEELIHILTSSKDEASILTTKKVRPNAMWITRALLRKIRKRNQLYSRIKKSPNNIQLSHAYKLADKNVKVRIKQAKFRYYSNRIRKDKTLGDVWKIINMELNGDHSFLIM